jgi:hypothetical protein
VDLMTAVNFDSSAFAPILGQRAMNAEITALSHATCFHSQAPTRESEIYCARRPLKLRKDRKPHVEKVLSVTMRWNLQENRLIFCKTARERCGGVILFCALENVERSARGGGGCEILCHCFRLVEFCFLLFCVLLKLYFVFLEFLSTHFGRILLRVFIIDQILLNYFINLNLFLLQFN